MKSNWKFDICPDLYLSFYQGTALSWAYVPPSKISWAGSRDPEFSYNGRLGIWGMCSGRANQHEE